MGSYSIRDVGLVNQLDRLEKEMAFMKSRQYIGKKTLATKINRAAFKTLSNDAWYNEEVGPPQLQALNQDVTFVAENQLNPFGILLVEFSDLSGNVIATYGTSAGTTVGGGPSISDMSWLITPVDSKKLSWNIQCVGPATPKWYVRYIVAATDSGTVGQSADLIHY